MSEFKPEDYKSYSELPEDQKSNYEELPDGEGFYVKGAEKDPELAHALAVIDDEAINALAQHIEANNFSVDEIMAQFKIAAGKYDSKSKRLYGEILRVLVDHDRLRGKEPDSRIISLFKETYAPQDYSEMTQEVILSRVDMSDIPLVTKLLKDKNISRKRELIEKISDQETFLQILDLAKDDLEIVSMLISANDDVDMKLKMLQVAVDNIKHQGQDISGNTGPSYYLGSIRQNVTGALIKNGQGDMMIELMDKGYLEAKNAISLAHTIEDDNVLAQLAARLPDIYEVMYMFKFIADPKVLAKIEESNEKQFKVPENDRLGIKILAEKFRNALSKKPEIYRAGKLGEDNKFVFSMSDDGEHMAIAWSNTRAHEYHRDIFDSLSRKTGKNYPKKMRSGGYVDIRGAGSATPQAQFYSSSGDFGNYGHRALEVFKEQIKASLQEELGADKEIEIKILVSS